MTGASSIEAVVVGLVEAWQHHDMTALGRLYAENADFVTAFGDWWKGRDQIVSEHASRHEAGFRTSELTFLATEIRPLRPDVAIVRSRWRLSGLRSPGGTAIPDRTGILVHVVEQRDGNWRIVTTQNTDVAPR